MLFRQTLTAETDRGVALICAAYLGEELRALLEKSLVEAPSVVGKLFEGTGPFATFSSRIDVAFANGLLSDDRRRALHLIRRIRNDFAHDPGERRFRDADMSARCRELLPLNPFADEKNPRNLYIRAVLTILAETHAKGESTLHAQIPLSRSLDRFRDAFAKTRETLGTLMGNLTEEQISRLSNSETKAAEKKRIVLEVLTRAGINLGKSALK
jgi:hypothetical protein